MDSLKNKSKQALISLRLNLDKFKSNCCVNFKDSDSEESESKESSESKPKKITPIETEEGEESEIKEN